MAQTDIEKTFQSHSRTKANRSPELARSKKPACVELKGSVFTLSVLCLRSFDVDAVGQELKKRIEQAPQFFKNAPVVLDLKELNSINQVFNFNELVNELRNTHHLVPVGVRYASPKQNEAALEAGLAVMQGGSNQDKDEQKRSNKNAQATTCVDGNQKGNTATSQNIGPTKLVENPVRSGQQVYAEGGDLVVMAAVNAGAEVLADGNIHIYAPLRGRALAGVQGNEHARIFCYSMEAELISVAGNYRVFEDQVPEQYQRKPVQVYLERDRLVISPFGK